MKRFLFVIGALLSFGFLGCDDGGGDKPDYGSLCQSSCDIDETCNLLDQATVDECVAACEEEAVNQLDGFFEAFVACKESHTCQELSEGGENSTICYDENVEECTTDTEVYVETACRSQLACDGIDDPSEQDLDECMDVMHADGNVLRCFTSSKLQEAVDCIEAADGCSPDPVKECVESILGLTLGNNPSNNSTPE